MKKNLLVVAAIFMVSGTVNAAQTNTGCQGNCPSGDLVNNAGGAGGNATGGVGIGTGIGFGGNATGGNASSSSNSGVIGSGNSASNSGVYGSGNSNVRNDNANVQGQTQGQSQSSSNRNSNNAVSRNQNASAANNNNTNANSGNNAAQSASTVTSVQVTGDTYVAPRIPVATAYAPNNVPTATCMGSSSVGFSAVGFSMSGGSSWVDSNCQLLEQVRTVAQVLGQPQVAAQMLADGIPAYAAAVAKLTGRAVAPTKAVDVGVDTATKVAYTVQYGN